MKTIGLKSSIDKSDESLDLLLGNLEKKSQKNTKEYLSAYEVGEGKYRNEVYQAMTRTSEIEKKSNEKIKDIFNNILIKSNNPKAKIILEKIT